MSARLSRTLVVSIVSFVTLLTFLNGDGDASAARQLSSPRIALPSSYAPADAALIARLEEATGSTVRVSRHARTGKVRFIGTTLAHPIPQPAALPSEATAEEAARQFLATYGQLFGLSDQARQLTVMRAREVDRGRSFVRFQQIFKEIPVLGGELIVQLSADRSVISASGEVLPDLGLDTVPEVAAEAAQKVAGRLVAKGYELDPGELNVSEPELWIYNPILLKPALDLSYLVWRMDVYPEGLGPVDELVLIDAHRGSAVLHFNQIAAGKDRAIYDNNNDPEAGLPGNGPVRAEGEPPIGIPDVDGAYDLAGEVYDAYFDWHGRDSLDNAGMTITSTVRYCSSGSEDECPLPNAFWLPRYKQIVYGEGYAQIDDVAAHELTHGVTNSESDLYYYMQSGAMNESLSDIWGEFVDLTNERGNDAADVRWLLGEDAGFVVAKSGPGPDKTLRFHPDADFFYRPPANAGTSGLQSAQDEVYQGRRYFLEIFPSSDVEAGQDYAVSIGVTSIDGDFHRTYLPLIAR
ncbi:MAG: Zinc metalloproteinase [Anaerolineales bacterium]|nr:Zinc metalloproteinase [Anaerolineales bacterium]